MINALDELKKILAKHKLQLDDILCAKIEFENYLSDDNDITFKLKFNYSNDDLNLFLNSLNFEYNNEYSSQKLNGIIWLNNNRWIRRQFDYEYGTQWWSLYECPTIPQDLE